MHEERDIIQSVEKGEWASIPNFDDIKKKMERAASETSRKDYRMNIRLARRDVEALKTKALEEGVPYQTLVASILHKYVTGRLVQRNDHSSKTSSS